MQKDFGYAPVVNPEEGMPGLLSLFPENIDAVSHATGSEAVVDIDHSNTGGTTVEHGKQGGNAPKRRAITDAGRHSYDWFVHQTPENTG
jgi:hypothetical protein